MPTPHTIIYARPTPPRSSYWVGATRAELAQHIAGRRHQMEAPTLKDIRFDPAIAATVSLSEAHAYRKLGRERP